MDNEFVTQLVKKKFDAVTRNKLMSKVSNWNKCQEYFDSNPELQEIYDCLAVELQTKARPQICKRLHQRWENILRGLRANAIGHYLEKKN